MAWIGPVITAVASLSQLAQKQQNTNRAEAQTREGQLLAMTQQMGAASTTPETPETQAQAIDNAREHS